MPGLRLSTSVIMLLGVFIIVLHLAASGIQFWELFSPCQPPRFRKGSQQQTIFQSQSYVLATCRFISALLIPLRLGSINPSSNSFGKKECFQKSTAGLNMAKLIVLACICFHFTDIAVLANSSDAKVSATAEQINNDN